MPTPSAGPANGPHANRPKPPEVTPYDEDRYDEDTMRYAIGDDLVISGVAYDPALWESDGEGGVEPRHGRGSYRFELGCDCFLCMPVSRRLID